LELEIIENTGGLIRQNYPKGKALSGIPDTAIKAVMDESTISPENALGIKHAIRCFWQ